MKSSPDGGDRHILSVDCRVVSHTFIHVVHLAPTIFFSWITAWSQKLGSSKAQFSPKLLSLWAVNPDDPLTQSWNNVNSLRRGKISNNLSPTTPHLQFSESSEKEMMWESPFLASTWEEAGYIIFCLDTARGTWLFKLAMEKRTNCPKLFKV